MNPKIGKVSMENGERFPDTITGDTASKREEFGRQFVHPFPNIARGMGAWAPRHAAYDRRVVGTASASDILVVMASLGRRPEFLQDALESIAQQSVKADVVFVGPSNSPVLRDASERFGAALLSDPGSLPAAINQGIAERGSPYEFVTWLNDDDLLEPGALERTSQALLDHPNASAAYGFCRYIDGAGQQLWVNRTGKLAPWILKWGPDLIPQPGSLIRKSAWDHVGGLDESYSLAFDLDLLLRLQKVGPLVDVGQVVSSFRWHADSLTVDDRTRNITESERAKRAALGPWGRRSAWLWERPVRWATRVAANEVQRRARRRTGATTRR